jgi:hypothetical protein
MSFERATPHEVEHFGAAFGGFAPQLLRRACGFRSALGCSSQRRERR